MYHQYKLALLAITLALPFIILVLGNRFDSAARTFLRAALATAVTWGWLIAMRLIVVKADIALAESPEQLQHIYNGDGAKNAAALMFGWAPSLALVLFYWLVARVTMFARARWARRHVA